MANVVESNKKAHVKLLHCTCKSEFQDETYGKGLRVMNAAFKKGIEPHRYRCTGCGNVRND
jgi:hypothetical protein